MPSPGDADCEIYRHNFDEKDPLAKKDIDAIKPGMVLHVM